MLFCWVMGIWDDLRRFICGCPLCSTARALHLLPLVLEQVLKIAIVPFCGVGCPSSFQATGDRVPTLASLVSARPTKALFFDTGTLRLGPHIQARIGSSVGLSECVSS